MGKAAEFLSPHGANFGGKSTTMNLVSPYGGPGIRTQKSLRTPVFKTGAIAILPTLQTPAAQQFAPPATLTGTGPGQHIALKPSFGIPSRSLDLHRTNQFLRNQALVHSLADRDPRRPGQHRMLAQPPRVLHGNLEQLGAAIIPQAMVRVVRHRAQRFSHDRRSAGCFAEPGVHGSGGGRLRDDFTGNQWVTRPELKLLPVRRKIMVRFLDHNRMPRRDSAAPEGRPPWPTTVRAGAARNSRWWRNPAPRRDGQRPLHPAPGRSAGVLPRVAMFGARGRAPSAAHCPTRSPTM
jgi:hypothetical protein